jgi:hypothetical protein
MPLNIAQNRIEKDAHEGRALPKSVVKSFDGLLKKSDMVKPQKDGSEVGVKR